MKKIDSIQVLKKSRLNKIIKQINDDKILDEINKRIDILIDENKTTSKILQFHLTSGIIPAIACYEKMKLKVGKDNSYKLIQDTVLEYADNYGHTLIHLSKLPIFFSLLKILMAPFLNYMYPPEGWKFKWRKINKEVIAFDAHTCFYFNIFQKYGVPELTKIFCETDDICYRKFKCVNWKRTKTIGRGDEICDFRFESLKAGKVGKKV